MPTYEALDIYSPGHPRQLPAILPDIRPHSALPLPINMAGRDKASSRKRKRFNTTPTDMVLFPKLKRFNTANSSLEDSSDQPSDLLSTLSEDLVHSLPASTTTMVSQFLELPAEIRNRIYQLLLPAGVFRVSRGYCAYCSAPKKRHAGLDRQNIIMRSLSQILLVCRQIIEEAFEFFDVKSHGSCIGSGTSKSVSQDFVSRHSETRREGLMRRS